MRGLCHGGFRALGLWVLGGALAWGCVRKNTMEEPQVDTLDDGGVPDGSSPDGGFGTDSGVEDPCDQVTCSLHGVCVAVDGAAFCDCDDGYFNAFGPTSCEAPQIRVSLDGVELASLESAGGGADAGAFEFGEVTADGDGQLASAYASLKISNDGTVPLFLNGVFIAEGDALDFDVEGAESTSIAPSESVEMGVRFDPLSLGYKCAVATIASGDPDDGTFSFAVAGSGFDGLPPAPLTAAIVFENLDDTGFAVRWNEAWDDFSAPGSLEYSVYLSTEADLETVAALTAEKRAMDWSVGVSSFLATGLEPGQTYCVNVAVRDGANNTAIYGMASATTLHVLRLYAALPHEFESEHLGGREGVDALCRAQLPEDIDATWHVRAFLSTGDTDALAGFTAGPKPVPDHVQIRGQNDGEHVLAQGFGELFSAGPEMSLRQAIPSIPAEISVWASGSDTDGTAAMTCGGWTAPSMEPYGYGRLDAVDSKWIADLPNYTCDAPPASILCLAWAPSAP